MKVIQITFDSFTGVLYGLTEDGSLVKWNPNILMWEIQGEA